MNDGLWMGAFLIMLMLIFVRVVGCFEYRECLRQASPVECERAREQHGKW